MKIKFHTLDSYMLKVCLSSCFLLISYFSVAQSNDCQYKVEGTMYNLSNQQPLPYGNVHIAGTQKGAVADEFGHFEITDICMEEFDLIFSFVGYKEVIHHHDIYHELPKIYLAPTDVNLESIVVEGEQIIGDLQSGTVSSISVKDLQQNQSGSLGDLASNISGVTVIKTGQNVVKPVIHGLSSNRILIINNGVRHEFQNWGAEHAPEIDPSLISNLQVIKGAATVRYGPDALGGVLLIDNPPLELMQPLRGAMAVMGKSNGNSAEGSMELQKGFERTAVMAQVSWLQQGDLSTPNYQLTNTGKKEKSLALGARYHFANVDLNFYYSHFDQELGILRASVTGNLDDLINAIESEVPPDTQRFSYQINNPKQTVKHDLFKLKGRWNGQNQLLEMQYAFQINQRQEFDVRRGTNNSRPAIDLELFSHTLDIDWKHPQIGNWTGSLGVQTLYQDNNNIPGTNTVPFVPNYNNSRIGVYMIENRQLSQKDWIELGIRYDYQFSSVIGREPDNDIYNNDINYQNASVTFGYRSEITPDQTFRTNIGTAWRPPNISELYFFGRHQSTIEYGLLRFELDENNNIITNNILTEKEKPAPSEMGLKWVSSYQWRSPVWDAELTGYVNYVANYIYSRPGGITTTVRGAFPFFLFEQLDALFAGADFSAHVNHNKNWYSEIRANYLWARDVGNGDYLIGIPPTNISYGINFKKRKWGPLSSIESGIMLNYFFEQGRAPRVISVRDLLDAKLNEENLFAEDGSNFDFLPPPDDYLLASLVWSADYKPLSFLFKVENLLNSSYRTYTDRLRYFADDLGINFSLSVKYKF
ncbi:TonB-dependent receptor [Cyclobacterium plantarum]|uniref:TonB-dependent receptor n=1 Tax=Cyclobacterium plantarum TaxID=2716263 RepID=A0ABX0H7U6_9BACT|nr:TonB-dependent receptor [Cyclobacterium plantarum]NHE56463.1 TonB-dependent receptor [Cyclobacterium plantarum]